MTTITNNTILSKGIFAVGVVAIAGVVGAVNFAQAAPNNTTSGYGTTSQQAIAASDTFENSVADTTNSFIGDVADAQAAAKTALTPTGTTSVNAFDNSFDDATIIYADSVNTAFDTFRAQVANDANTAVSKDQFIDQFNHAKADYLNSLDAAKNKLADSINQLGGNGNAVAKDNFMNAFNSDRDAYSNALEAAKNDFAATLG